ncbi:MAG: diaminopimelate epimerase [Ferruginibacter sp.]
MDIEFYKYQGTGNDFIIIDNRNGKYDELSAKDVKHFCDRKFGIGADGLMMMNTKDGYDFEMIYYNSDGRPGSMCGNGGRCLVRFAKDMGIHKTSYSFIASDGPHEAEIDLANNVRLKMKDVTEVDAHPAYAVLNTGSPHYIKYSSDVRQMDVFKKGREIRYSSEYEKEGINVNFVESTGPYSVFMRTYERGVEDETLSCGTGVTAAALMSAHNDRGFNEVKVQTPGGDLSVEFTKTGDHSFTDIRLCGPAEYVFKGRIHTL